MEQLICHQEEHPGIHHSIREIALALSISKTSLHRMVERKGFCAYMHLTTPHMTTGCKQRRLERSALLSSKLVFHNEKDFLLLIPTNRQNNQVHFSAFKKILTLLACFMKVTNSPKK